MPLWTQVYFLAFWPLLVGVCGASIVWGDRPVRFAAILMLLMMLLASPLVATIEFERMEIGLAITDVVLMLGLTWCSIRAPRWWLIAMASLQLLMVLGHLAKLLWPATSSLAYAIATGGAAYLQLILLSIGLLLAIRSRRSTARRPASR